MSGMSSDGTIDLERRYAIAELDDFPEDGRRFELADEWVIVSPKSRRLQQVACKNLGILLNAVCPQEWFAFGLPINVDDPDATHFEPDVTVVRRDMATIENGDTPILAIEVRSPSTAGRDAVLKRREYARLGIGSYWLVDVDAPSIRVLELAGDDYVEVGYAEGETPIDIERPFPVRIIPAALIRV